MLLFRGFRPPQTIIPGDFASRSEMYVRVRKRGVMVETLRHYNFGPNVLFVVVVVVRRRPSVV